MIEPTSLIIGVIVGFILGLALGLWLNLSRDRDGK